jgi:RNA methyltransferase, TrmH family
MISKAKISLIRSLEKKKYRLSEGLFVAEGPKVIGELSKICSPVELYEGEDADKASFLQHPQGMLALFPIDIHKHLKPQSGLKLLLDGVQDPGNFGTIIRIADWFGIDHVYCSAECADAFSPKVVQATMGSLARVNTEYCDPIALLDALPEDCPVYGTLLDGDSIYDNELTENGIIVMGNEGNGISEAVRQRVNRRLLIPHFPADRPSAESLNVAVATAIVCSEFRRRMPNWP